MRQTRTAASDPGAPSVRVAGVVLGQVLSAPAASERPGRWVAGTRVEEPMTPDEEDQARLVAQLASEISVAVDRVGEFESWVAKRLDGSIDDDALDQACTRVAEKFLTSDPPQTGAWEHLLVTLAVHSSRSRDHHGLDACRAVVGQVSDMLGDERLGHFKPAQIMTLASAMTIVLAVQDRLHQDVEETIRRLCDGFPDVLPQIAEQCQDIWTRRGQMSGRPGMFLWDRRRQEWRLAQDFKPYRASA